MNFLEPQDWSFPVPIIYGPGRLSEIADLSTRAGMTKPLIVTDRGSAGLPFIADLKGYLSKGGLDSAIYSDISPNPRDDEIAAGKAQYRAGGHDGIIAIGGGSGMDGGKALALRANNDLDVWAFEYEQSPPDMACHLAFPPLITIPTTAGTGAETESTAMITDTVRKMKWCIWHADLKPAFAVLDPEITLGLPVKLTACTGVDAMVHAIEAYCVPDYHPMCDGIALEALALIGQWLPCAVEEPGSMTARGGMQIGACLAGVSFLKGLGLVHAISHMVGAEFDTHHGLTNAIALPAVLRFNAPAISHKLPALSRALGLESADFASFDAAICQMLDRLDIPRSLSDIGVPVAAARSIAEKAHQDAAAATNPREADVETIERLVIEAITKGR